MNLSRIFVLRLLANRNRDSLIARLIQLPQVLYAEPNALVRMRAVIPNDTHFGLQWALRNTGQSGGTPGADIKATDAWDIFQGSSSVRIGIVDVGRVQNTHPEFANRIGGNFNTAISDHATHVAGIAAAKGNNSAGVAGVDWNAQINTQTIAGDIPSQAIAVRAAVDSGSHVTNNSWGQGSNTFSVTLKQAFVYAYKHNVSSVVAMAATYSPEDYPNAYGAGIINVAGTTDRDAAASYTVQRNYVDVAAPGGDWNSGRIYSTIPTSTYGYMYGTSMAAPHVAVIASLLKGYNPNLYNDDIENIIKLSVDDKGPAGWDPEYGTGRVNAKKALDYLRSPYTLQQNSASGSTYLGPYSPMLYLDRPMYGVPGLQDGIYDVKAYEVLRDVTFQSYESIPSVWGRGVATIGYSPIQGPDYAIWGMGWCEPVAGTITTNSVTLRTFVYEVGDYRWIPEISDYEFFSYGFYPTTPTNASYAYSVLGILSRQGWAEQGALAKIVPGQFALSQNYPNPFNSSATIKYQLPADGAVRMSVFNVLGQEVVTLVNESRSAGFYTARFDASHLPSGVYFARISVTSSEGKPIVQTIKMQVTK